MIITVEETAPAQDEAVTEAFTYPNCAITFSHESPYGIIIKSSSGTEFECLGILTSIEDGKDYEEESYGNVYS